MSSIHAKVMQTAGRSLTAVPTVERRDQPQAEAKSSAGADGMRSGVDSASGLDLDDILAQLDERITESRSTAAPPVSPQAPVAPRVIAANGDAAAALPSGTLRLPGGIAAVNRSHFLASQSGEMVLWRESVDPETGYPLVVPVSLSSARLELAPIRVRVNTPDGVKDSPVFQHWLASKDRRTYPGGVVLQPEGIVAPGTLNLWGGFSVQPKAGDASPMLDHIQMLCSNDTEIAGYFINWLACAVQRPGSRPEVAVMLRGGQGTGKGTVFRLMVKIFGRHGLHITQQRHLVGNFNAHLRTALFVFVDEGYWAGDRGAEGVLKGLITEPTLAIEMKGVDVFMAPNRLKIAMASNGAWVVPAGADERRHCVIDVPTTRARDHAYFARLNEWIDGDGAAIFLDYLLHRDLLGFNVRAAPSTAALDRQKIENMAPLDRWLLDCLDAAALPGGESHGEWGADASRIRCDAARDAFGLYCQKSGSRVNRTDARSIGRRLGEVFDCGPATSARFGTAGLARGWTLPGLHEARKRAAAAFGLNHYVWGSA